MAIITIEVEDEGAAIVERRIRNAVSGVTITVKTGEITPSPLDKLTDVEKALVRLLITGMTAKEIAAELGKSYKTIDNQRAAILKRLGFPNLTVLIGTAYKAGWA